MKKVKTMALSYEEILNVWGRKLLKDRGYTVSDEARVSAELGTEGEGCCDDCWTETAVVVISVISKIRDENVSVSVRDYEFEKILLELVEISVNS